MVEHLTEESFKQKVLEEKGVALVDFYAEWCGPCKMMGPVIEELGTKYAGKAAIYKLDVDEVSKVAEQYRVMSVPTLFIFKDGEVVDQFLGMQDQGVLEDALDAKL